MSSHPIGVSEERNEVGNFCNVACLCIDMIGSTKFGLKLTNPQHDRFNGALVEQIRPHLKAFELTNSLVKFTGDGWLVLVKTEPEKIQLLCGLATVMAKKFQEEMGKKAKISKIPPLRLAICSGRDMCVELPPNNKNKDWVGDSARRAVRTTAWCNENEIVICESIKDLVFRDFIITPVDGNDHEEPANWEEKLNVYSLGDLKLEAAQDSEAPRYYVTTLETCGRVKEANEYSLEISKHLEARATGPGRTKTENQKILRHWNQLLSTISDYATSSEILRRIKAAGLTPDNITYNQLIDKAPDYGEATRLKEVMRGEGVSADVVTYTTLIKKALDFAEAKAVMDEMKKENIQPNDYTYTTLFNKNLSDVSAEDILSWYFDQDYHPSQPIGAAIASYQKTESLDQALRLTLVYPHLRAARRLIREHEIEALAYFSEILDRDPQNSNGLYALGIAMMELGRDLEAIPHLNKALELPIAGPRKNDIERRLRQIEN
jgi:tetratricopeptide (TPR) repeat protein